MPTDISGEFCRSSVQTAHSATRSSVQTTNFATQCVLGAALNCLGTTRNTPRTTGHICWQGLIALLAETRNMHPEHTISSISINRKCSWFHFNSCKTKFSLVQQVSQMHDTICGTKCTHVYADGAPVENISVGPTGLSETSAYFHLLCLALPKLSRN